MGVVIGRGEGGGCLLRISTIKAALELIVLFKTYNWYRKNQETLNCRLLFISFNYLYCITFCISFNYVSLYIKL